MNAQFSDKLLVEDTFWVDPPVKEVPSIVRPAFDGRKPLLILLGAIAVVMVLLYAKRTSDYAKQVEKDMTECLMIERGVLQAEREEAEELRRTVRNLCGKLAEAEAALHKDKIQIIEAEIVPIEDFNKKCFDALANQRRQRIIGKIMDDRMPRLWRTFD